MITLEEMKPTLLEKMGEKMCLCTKEAWGYSKEPKLKSLPKTPIKVELKAIQVNVKNPKGGGGGKCNK
jgi:hypothetical protein